MTEASERIPAWRRLGLTLKSEGKFPVTQTNPAVSVWKTSHDDRLSDFNRDWHGASQQCVEPIVSGKSSKLGKRKHQHAIAETNEVTPKKRGKHHSENIQHVGFDTQTASTAKSYDDTIRATSKLADQADNGQSKGDPNYRRKSVKQKGSKTDVDGSRNINSLKEDLSTHSLGKQKVHPTLLASTENDANSTPPPKDDNRLSNERSVSKNNSDSSSTGDHRKSVTFTPDTKTSDGSSAQDLFKKWAAEQKKLDSFLVPSENSISTLSATTLQLEENQNPAKTTKKDKRVKAQQNGPEAKPLGLDSGSRPSYHQSASTEVNHSSRPTPAVSDIKAKGRKKDISLYTAYLTQYHKDREHWKFNKAKQNDVIDNALNVFRIPEEYLKALVEYVSGLKGAGVIARLSDKCTTVLAELDREDAQDRVMDKQLDRQALQDAAMRERVAKERKRRKVEGDVEKFANHPHGDGYVRRMKRERAEALLTALARTAPVLPATQTNGINPAMKTLAPQFQRDSKKRKRRGEVSSDESSSESSSSSSEDEDSSSDSESTDDGYESSSTSEAASKPDAESEPSDNESTTA